MTAALHPSSFNLPPSTGWITLEEAARRAGYKAVGSLRHRLKEWIPTAQARQTKRGKGKPIWEVQESADPRFARVKFPEQLPFDMSAIDAAHRAVILAREKILLDWEAAVARGIKAGLSKDQATAQFIDLSRAIDGKKFSRANLYNWHRDYRAQGRAGLQDDRKNRAASSDDAGDPFLQQVKTLWLTQNQPKLRACYHHTVFIARQEGWEIRSLSKTKRFMAKLPPQLVVKMRLGPTAFANTVVPYAERDYTSIDSNSIWCADHHQFDVIATHEGKFVRPWITAWEDLRSRKIVGYHIFAHDPNQNTILLSFRNGCLSHGVPLQAYVDNGKDFDSYLLQGQTKQERFEKRRIKVTYDAPHVGGVFGALGVQVLHAQPYNAKAKPVERFFETAKDRFCRMFFATFFGGHPGERPENHTEQLERGNAPELADFISAFATWVEADYHAHEHTGDGMLPGESPAEAFGRCLKVKRTAREEDLELLHQKTSRPLKVHRNGVTFGALTYGKGDPALDPYFGKDIYLRVGDDISRASAWTTGDKIIAILKANSKVPFGATDQDYRAAQIDRRRIRNVVKEAQQLGPRRNFDVLDLMAEQRAKQLKAQRPDPSQPPPVLQPIRTPLEGQLDALQNRTKQPIALRLAAGGERDVQAPPRSSILAAADDFDIDRPPSRAGSILSLAERLGD